MHKGVSQSTIVIIVSLIVILAMAIPIVSSKIGIIKKTESGAGDIPEKEALELQSKLYYSKCYAFCTRCCIEKDTPEQCQGDAYLDLVSQDILTNCETLSTPQGDNQKAFLECAC